ncbi:hypothetical protein Tco_0615040 [Tanacetum coccineum]
MTRLELFRIKSMWGNYAFDYACSMARGLSGGLISIWDPNMFSKNSIWCDDSFIIIKGNWKNVTHRIMRSPNGFYIRFGDIGMMFRKHRKPTSDVLPLNVVLARDPLSPFLFILVMEGLHNAFEEAMILGLKINIHKSNIYGIGVNKDEVLSMASNAGCIAGDIPFNYLGLPIGSNMKSIASWKTLVMKPYHAFIRGGFVQMVVASRAIWATLLEPPVFSTRSFANAIIVSANHIFFECDIATDMWKLVFRWCDIPLFQASSWDSFNDWIIFWHASKEKKQGPSMQLSLIWDWLMYSPFDRVYAMVRDCFWFFPEAGVQVRLIRFEEEMDGVDYLKDERKKAQFDVDVMKVVWAGSRESFLVSDRMAKLVANDPV